MNSSDLTYTPSQWTILPHYISGALCFLFCSVLLFFAAGDFTGHYFQPHLLGITHLLVLGWATMIIFGALYQILPVILEVKLFSEVLARISFILLLTGAILISYSFWKFNVGLPLQSGAFSVMAAVTIFLINIVITSRKAENLKTDTEFIVTAGIWLWITVAAGTLLAFNLTGAFLPKDHLEYLKVHAHFGLAGWFLLLIIGVASRLVPMFLVSPVKDFTLLNIAYYLINLGLIGFSVNVIVFENTVAGIAFPIMIASGIPCFVVFLYKVYKNRVKKNLDTGLKQAMTAFVVILLPMLAGIALTIHNDHSDLVTTCTMVYGVTIFIGFISGLILGKTYKILPFIFILLLSRKHKTKGQFTLKQQDLYSAVLAKLQFYSYLGTVILLITGIFLKQEIIVKAGSIMLMATALLYNITIIQMLVYYTKRMRG